MQTLEGSVESIVFRNEDNHYTVARFRTNDNGRLFRDDLTTIVGTLPGIHVGELLSIEGITRYLGSGLIKGIGPKKAKLIVEHFGEQTLAIIEQQPERLREVKGISARDREQIAKSWAEQSEVKELHLFLQSHDVSVNLATRIYKQYGQDSIKVIRENPYKLAQDVNGIGFRTADEIAVKLGLPRDSVPRLATGLKHVLTQAANEDGHCFLPQNDLLRRASTILQAPYEALPAAMEQLRHERDVFIEPPLAVQHPVHPVTQVGEANGRFKKEIDNEAPPIEWSETEEPELQQRVYYGPFWHAEQG